MIFFPLFITKTQSDFFFYRQCRNKDTLLKVFLSSLVAHYLKNLSSVHDIHVTNVKFCVEVPDKHCSQEKTTTGKKIKLKSIRRMVFYEKRKK